MDVVGLSFMRAAVSSRSKLVLKKSESLISRLVKPVRQLISVITILVTQIYKNAPEAMLSC